MGTFVRCIYVLHDIYVIYSIQRYIQHKTLITTSNVAFKFDVRFNTRHSVIPSFFLFDLCVSKKLRDPFRMSKVLRQDPSFDRRGFHIVKRFSHRLTASPYGTSEWLRRHRSSANRAAGHLRFIIHLPLHQLPTATVASASTYRKLTNIHRYPPQKHSDIRAANGSNHRNFIKVLTIENFRLELEKKRFVLFSENEGSCVKLEALTLIRSLISKRLISGVIT